MAILLLTLFFIALVFLFYYELLWKSVEKQKKKNLLSMAGEFAFADTASTGTGRRKKRGKYKKRDKTPWGDWRYRLLVELHRRGQINPEEGAKIVGVSTKRIEEYLDKLEGEGKVQSAGDSKRGIFYRIVNEA